MRRGTVLPFTGDPGFTPARVKEMSQAMRIAQFSSPRDNVKLQTEQPVKVHENKGSAEVSEPTVCGRQDMAGELWADKSTLPVVGLRLTRAELGCSMLHTIHPPFTLKDTYLSDLARLSDLPREWKRKYCLGCVYSGENLGCACCATRRSS
jgi:hypothetical protein